MTGQEWQDDVPRLKAFEADNPDTEITSDLSRVHDAFKGVLPVEGEDRRFAASTLGGLLDLMERAARERRDAAMAAVTALRKEHGGRYRVWWDGKYRAQRSGDGEMFSGGTAAMLREALRHDMTQAGESQ